MNFFSIIAKISLLVMLTLLELLMSSIDAADANQMICYHPVVKIAGPAKPVFIAQRDRCNDGDVPDSPAMAFINDHQQVVLFNGISGSYPSIGPDFNNLKRDCRQPLFSNNPNREATPAAYHNRTWLRDPWTKDGKTIYALVHNEFHGWQTNPQQNCTFGIKKKCVYFSITAAISTDGGKFFHIIKDANGDVIPAIISPFPYVPDGGQQGMIQQSNILSKTDARGKTAYYILVNFTGGHGFKRGVCLMRNNDISNPNSWKAWDGNGFNISVNANPYRNPNLHAAEHVCTPVSQHLPATSWTYNTILHEYISVGHMSLNDNVTGERGEAFGYSTSPDMIHWSRPTVIQKVNWLIGYVQSAIGSGVEGQEYPSLLDPTSAGRNFEFSGAHPYLYFTHVPPKTGMGDFQNRDLYREPLSISCR